MKKRNLPVYLTEEQYLAIRSESIRVGLTMSGLVTQLVQRFVVEKAKRFNPPIS